MLTATVMVKYCLPNHYNAHTYAVYKKKKKKPKPEVLLLAIIISDLKNLGGGGKGGGGLKPPKARLHPCIYSESRILHFKFNFTLS